jgi:hypothetical protein
MKRIFILGMMVALNLGASCHGIYARKVGEIKIDYSSKECIYEASRKRYSLLWGAYDQCPYSIEVDYKGHICKVN